MNEAIFYFFYNLSHQNSVLDRVIVFLAEDFLYVYLMLAMLFVLMHHELFKAENIGQVFKQKYKEIFLVFISGGSAWVLAHAFKFLIYSPRPFEALQGVTSLFEKTGSAFPSGHAALSMAIAISIFYCHRRAGYVFMGLSLIMSSARIAAGMHFPIDILGGFALGGLIAMLLEKHFPRFA